MWEREHEPDCLSNLQFVSGGDGKRQFLYYIFSYLYTGILVLMMNICNTYSIYECTVYTCIYVCVHVFSATNARKQLSFGLEPEFRSSVAFCARFAAPFVHTYIHRYIQTSLRMPRTAMCECVCVCVCFLHSVLTGIYAFTAFVLIVLIINSITKYCPCLFSM